jgi:cell division protein FtsL
MVVSAFVLTFQWLEKTQYARGDAIIVLSAMVLIAALASLMLSVEQRLRKIEERIESTERGLRINIQSVEENMDRKLSIAEKAIRRAEYH